MTIVFVTILIWGVAMIAWLVVSRFAKSSDFDRLKNRLVGAPKKKKKQKKDAAGPQQVIHQEDTTKNQFAQQLVNKYQWGPKLAEFLEQAGMRMSAARFVHLTLVLFMGGVAFGWLMLPIAKPAAIFLGVAAGAGPYVYARMKRKARLKKFEEIFPDTLEFVSRSMRAGHAFSVSLEMIHREFPEPVSSEFRRTFEEHNLGLPIEVALQKLAKRIPSLDVHFFVSAVLLQKRTGGNLAEILDKLAYVIRERFKLRGRIRAVSAHGKMTATALSCIPIAVAVLMFYTNPDYVKFFFLDEVGNYMLAAAIGLQIIGYLIMQKIVKIEV
jgi:tight adherence protein B